MLNNKNSFIKHKISTINSQDSTGSVILVLNVEISIQVLIAVLGSIPLILYTYWFKGMGLHLHQ